MSGSVDLRLYGELGDLVAGASGGTVTCRVALPASVGEVIRSAGVPVGEVHLVLVDGVPVGLDHRVAAGDRVAVYPRFRTLEAPGLDGPAGGQPRFVLDVHLGKLARHLRLLGFDVDYRNDYDDDELAAVSAREGRYLLTRDTGLLARSAVRDGYLVRADDPDEQVVEVVLAFRLCDRLDPFGRCLHCNGWLEEVDKQEILHRLEPKTRRYYQQFRRCTGCDRIYWRGSHTERLGAVVGAVRSACEQAGRRSGDPGT